MNIDLFILIGGYLVFGCLGFVVLMAIVTTIHELGHIFACVILGVKVNYVIVNFVFPMKQKVIRVRGFPIAFKGVWDDYIALVNYQNFTPKEGIIISLMGPLFNGLVFFVSVWIFLYLDTGSWDLNTKFVGFMWLIGNLLTLVLNLWPYPKSDGASILKYLEQLGIK